MILPLRYGSFALQIKCQGLQSLLKYQLNLGVEGLIQGTYTFSVASFWLPILIWYDPPQELLG